ncbi:MAG TPA: hypothetical protein VFS43_03180 [Polyangiaceae bacterium]|nr:hypothetical protein [Polyangiaceae bacterium]
MADGAERHYLVVDHFFAGAARLRAAYDARSRRRAPPAPDPAVWEYWHVPGQFSHHRTPARAFFPPDVFGAFERRLVAWASSSLGLSRLEEPPWLSFFLDGEYQGIHRDTANGAFAFTYGLSRPATPAFTGGETLLARPELLAYWRHGAHRAERGHDPLFDEIANRYDRLLAFDSRLPHAVRRVEGPRDPRRARVAVQGWLSAAGCVCPDGLEAAELGALVNDALASASGRGPGPAGLEGLVTLRVELSPRGEPRAVDEALNTLVAVEARAGEPARVGRAFADLLASLRWPAPGRRARVIVPIEAAEGRARVPPPDGAASPAGGAAAGAGAARAPVGRAERGAPV